MTLPTPPVTGSPLRSDKLQDLNIISLYSHPQLGPPPSPLRSSGIFDKGEEKWVVFTLTNN